VSVEKSWNGKAADVLVDVDGRRTAIELQISDPAAHATENLVRDLEAGIDEVDFVALTPLALKEVKQRIENDLAQDLRGRSLMERARYRLLAEFLGVYDEGEQTGGSEGGEMEEGEAKDGSGAAGSGGGGPGDEAPEGGKDASPDEAIRDGE
jgi:hypothetical protein